MTLAKLRRFAHPEDVAQLEACNLTDAQLEELVADGSPAAAEVLARRERERDRAWHDYCDAVDKWREE